MIDDIEVQASYDLIKESHTPEESATILLNSLIILGSRKVKLQKRKDCFCK